MLDDSFLGAFAHTFLFAGVTFGILFAGLWIEKEFRYQGEQIEELSSRLEKCEEKNDELKK